MRPLTSENREDVFVIDDSTYHKRGYKKTELVARVFDHVEMKYIKGFRMLTLGWSGGNTFIPIISRLLSSSKDENVLGTVKQLDKRSIAFRRRKEAREKATDVMIKMLKNAIKAGHRAKYVLFDSWFAFPSVIMKVCQRGLDVICMLKSMYRQYRTIRRTHLACRLFRHIAHKFLDLRQQACKIYVQSDEKSDCAIRTRSLCGIAYKSDRRY